MNSRKIILIVLVIVLCIFTVLFDLYYQGLTPVDMGDDYASVESLLLFVNKPDECKWAKGLGDRYLNNPLELFKYETTVVLMAYDKITDINFINFYSVSKQWFNEDLDKLNTEYKRLLDKISPDILHKDWQRVGFKSNEKFSRHYTYRVYTCDNEVLVIAESNHTS